jgi:parallel beta-helix repeat protein
MIIKSRYFSVLSKVFLLYHFYTNSPPFNMKRYLIFFFLLTSKLSFSQVGIGTNTPKAALDITSNKRGILLPRVALVATNDDTTVLAPNISEIVYNTSTSAAGNYQVKPGFYYWSGTLWIKFDAGSINSFSEFAQRPIGLNAADSGKKYLYTQTGNFHLWNGTAWLILNESSINIKDYGAVGDGVKNDIAAINAAANVAKNGYELVIPKGVFLVSSYILISNGTKAVYGKGGIIKPLDTASQIGVVLIGKEASRPENVKNCIVNGLIIDMNNSTKGGVGIYGQNISFCTISNNYVYNIKSGAGILIRAFQNGLEPSISNIITNNRIEGDTITESDYNGISIDSPIDLGGYSGQDIKWKATFITGKGYYPPMHNVITGNIVRGGYYGISISSSNYTVVTNNDVSYNQRNISCQNDCKYNNISNNILSESISSSIHLAYGSSFNLISNNNIVTNRGIGEGLLQAYVATKFNKFIGNNVASTGTGNKFYIYTGIHADGNEFSNNTLRGNCTHAYIAIESAWVANTTEPESRAFGNGTATDNFANTGTSGTIIKNNRIEGASPVAAIYTSQWSDANGNYNLENIELSDNVITTNNHSFQYKAFESTTGSLKNIIVRNNSFFNFATSNKFLFPRGRLHFTDITGNAIINNSIQTLPANITNPSIAIGYLFMCVNSIPTLITDFTGAKEGDEITIRLDIFTSLVNSPSLRLRGGANVTAVNSDNLIMLKRISNVWFEISRNF